MLGVAAAAKGNFVLLIIGLAISIPLIIYGSTFILKLMNRFPIIITLGGAVLGWVAGEMMVTDPVLSGWVESHAPLLHSVAPALGALLVVAIGKSIALSKVEKISHLPAGQVVLPEDEEPAPPGYHWVHRTWRRLPDGTRDYAAYYGKLAFRYLKTISSRLRTPRRK